MSDLASRTHAAALQMAAAMGPYVRKPHPDDFAHLNSSPDEVPEPNPDPNAQFVTGGAIAKAPMDAATTDQVNAILEELRTKSNLGIPIRNVSTSTQTGS